MDKKILIVDDEKPIVDILKFNLEKEGYKTIEAYDGEQAVEMALQTNVHPRDMYYFRDSYFHSFANDYKRSGAMYFSTKEN